MARTIKPLEATSVVALIASLVVLVLNCSPYFDGSASPQEFVFFRSFDHVRLWRGHGGHLLLILLCVHYLRMWCGINFIEFDRTFNDARRQARESKAKKRIEVILRVLVIGMLVAYGWALKRSVPLMMGLLIAQLVVIVGYNIILWKEYYVLDVQKEANRFILVGDLTYLFFVIWVAFTLYYEAVEGDQRFGSCALVLPLFLGAYSAILLGEIIAYYFQAMLIALAAFVDSLA